MAQTTTKTQAPTMAIAEAAPAENLPAPRARSTINPIVPQSWQEVVTIASAICRANMAPKSYCKVDNYGKLVYVDGKPVPEPEKVAIAIMHGMEVGMTPMASLQSLAVINGMPSLYGDGMLAVVRASGLLEDIVEEMEWDKQGPVKAVCRVKRRGEPTWGTMDCARDDAIKANWWGKEGPWKLTPHRMLQMRARGWALRDKFADVLRGLHSAEEVQDMVDITPQGAASTGPAPAEPRREDYKPQPSSPEPTPHSASGEGNGQPAASSPAGAGGDSKPEAASTPAPATEKAAPVEQVKPTVTDVEDQNEAKPTEEKPAEKPAEEKPKEEAKPKEPEKPAEPMVSFQDYEKAGQWFDFADPWLQDPARTEAELVAFSAYYNDWMQARLSPSWKSKPVREGVEDTKRLLDEALKRAQAKARADKAAL